MPPPALQVCAPIDFFSSKDGQSSAAAPAVSGAVPAVDVDAPNLSRNVSASNATIQTLHRRRLVQGQTITGSLPHRAPTTALRSMEAALMTLPVGHTLVYFRARKSLRAYPRVHQCRASPRQRHRARAFDPEGRWRISFQMVRRGPCKNVNRIHTLPLPS